MKQSVEFVLTRTITFEKVLKEYFNAKGSGLGSMVHAIQDRLPNGLTKKLQFLARERNKIAHGDGVVDAEAFERVAEEARGLLNALLVERRTNETRRKLKAWIAQCPVELNDRVRHRLLSAIQQTSTDKPRRRDATQFSRPKSSSERK